MKVGYDVFINVALTKVLQIQESQHEILSVNDWINYLDPKNDFNPEYLSIVCVAPDSQMEFQIEAVSRCVKGLLGTKSTLQHLKMWLQALQPYAATCDGFFLCEKLRENIFHLARLACVVGSTSITSEMVQEALDVVKSEKFFFSLFMRFPVAKEMLAVAENWAFQQISSPNLLADLDRIVLPTKTQDRCSFKQGACILCQPRTQATWAPIKLCVSHELSLYTPSSGGIILIMFFCLPVRMRGPTSGVSLHCYYGGINLRRLSKLAIYSDGPHWVRTSDSTVALQLYGSP